MRRSIINSLFALVLAALVMGAAPSGVSEDDRLASLAETPRDSATFPDAILEAAKIQYRRSRWSEFFGLATYSRVVFPTSQATSRLVVLEAMALLRHCQFDRARALMTRKAPAETSSEWKRARRLVEDWLELTRDARVEEKTEDKTTRPKPVFDSTVLWPVGAQAETLGRLSPFGMRRTVEPLCQGGTP